MLLFLTGIYFIQFDPATAVNDFIHMIAEKPLKYGIIGLISSAVSQVVCLTTKDWNIATVKPSILIYELRI